MNEENRGGGSLITPPERDYTGLAYLNDDFTGGELVFPHLNVVCSYRPEARFIGRVP